MFFKKDSVSIHYEIFEPPNSSERNENPILFIHGNEEDLTYFDFQYSFFSKKYTCIGVDCRGRGKSSFGDTPLSISLMSDDIISLLLHIGVSKVDIVGFSDGANIALDIAFKKPELVDRLILAGGNLYPSGMNFFDYAETLIYYHIYNFLSKICRNEKKIKYKRKKELYKLMAKEPNFTYESLNEIKSPTLVAVGEYDVIKFSHSKKTAESLPFGTLKIISGGSHFFPSEMPDSFNKEICNFLKGKAVKKSKRIKRNFVFHD